MKPFLQKCIGISLLIFSAGFLIRSVQPALAGKNGDSISSNKISMDKNERTLLWINIDSIDANYKAFAELSDKAGGDLNLLTQKYQEKSLEVQKRYDALQRRATAGLISADYAEKEQNAINAEAEEVQMMETQISSLQTHAMEINDSIAKTVKVFLKDFAKRKNADYIFGSEANNDFLYSNESFDVTQEVLIELNALYDKQKK